MQKEKTLLSWKEKTMKKRNDAYTSNGNKYYWIKLAIKGIHNFIREKISALFAALYLAPKQGLVLRMN